MANSRKGKAKAPAIDVPQTREEAAAMLEELGKAQRELEILNLQKGGLIAEAQQTIERHYAWRLESLAKKIGDHVQGLHAWAAANRKAEAHGKEIGLETGFLYWRLTPPKVNVRKVKDVIEACRRLRLTRFLRTKVEIDKEAMLKAPEKAASIDGVTITQTEIFYAEPDESPAPLQGPGRKVKS